MIVRAIRRPRRRRPGRLVGPLAIAFGMCGALLAARALADPPPAGAPPSDAAPLPAPPVGDPATAAPALAPGSSGPAPSSSLPSEEQFRLAGAAYETGRYPEAAESYERLLAAGYDDARVHYNLGNARFKEGKIGLAILAYERALARNPSDVDTKENLAYASLLTTDKVGAGEDEFPARLMAALDVRFGRPRARAVAAIACLVAGLLAIPLWFSPRRALGAVLWSGVGAALAVALVCGAILAVESIAPVHAPHAIVLASTTDGRSAPSADGTVLFTVHEGLKVEIRGERPGWIQVALPNGLAGWIEAASAERI